MKSRGTAIRKIIGQQRVRLRDFSTTNQMHNRARTDAGCDGSVGAHSCRGVSLLKANAFNLSKADICQYEQINKRFAILAVLVERKLAPIPELQSAIAAASAMAPTS